MVCTTTATFSFLNDLDFTEVESSSAQGGTCFVPFWRLVEKSLRLVFFPLLLITEYPKLNKVSGLISVYCNEKPSFIRLGSFAVKS